MVDFNEGILKNWINGSYNYELKEIKDINNFYSTDFEVPNISKETKEVNFY